jgi:hypothetical protein
MKIDIVFCSIKKALHWIGHRRKSNRHIKIQGLTFISFRVYKKNNLKNDL